MPAIRFFADLPEDELAVVASMASEEEITPGQLLAAEGRTGYSLYAIESSYADVVINGETVATIGAGDVVGEMAVLISPPDWSEPPEVAIGGVRTAKIVRTFADATDHAVQARRLGAGPASAGHDWSACEQYSMSVVRKTLSARWAISAHKASRAVLRAQIRPPTTPSATFLFGWVLGWELQGLFRRPHKSAGPQRRPRLLPEEAGRGKNAQRRAPVPRAQNQRRHLRPPPGRRPPGRSGPGEGPGRAPGERLCIHGAAGSPRTPALRTSLPGPGTSLRPGSRPVEEPGKCRSSTAPPPTDTSLLPMMRGEAVE